MALCLSLDGCSSAEKGRLQDALTDLDEVIAERPVLEMVKAERIRGLEETCQDEPSYGMRIPLARKIVEEYTDYNLDSTRAWIGRWRRWAELASLPDEALESDLVLGEVLANAGYYLEAFSLLGDVPDPQAMPEGLSVVYYHALYRLADNVEENALHTDGGGNSLKHKLVYADTLLSLYTEDSPEWHSMLVNKYMDQRAFELARQENRLLLEGLDPDSRDYARAAFYESVLCDSLGLAGEKLLWEIASARADFKNVVKNYASLTLIASDLMDSDIDRSFRYIQTALSDAVFYNAKLRPWQISRSLIDIQQGWGQHQLRTSRRLGMLTGLLLLSVCLLVGATIAIGVNLHRVSRTKREMESLNQRLKESNGIKEHYIGLFLSQISENIGRLNALESHVIKALRYGKGEKLLKELVASNAAEEERDAFYDTFDSTFLAMYPDFVPQFNALLLPEAQIVPPKGKKLNTELRIFALMRLGIENSNDIAALLKYSVRTIYNYKVKIRNSAAVSRAEFDEKIRGIG